MPKSKTEPMDSDDVTAKGSPHPSNGFPPEKTQSITLDDANDSDAELGTPTGSDGGGSDLKALHDEIQSLRRDRSELQKRLDGLLAEAERSKVDTKAIADHASYLEGELMRIQEDLSMASSTAEDAEKERDQVRSEMGVIKKQLEEKIGDYELDRGRKEGEIRVLKEELRVSEEKRATREKEMKEMEGRAEAAVKKTREAMEEEVKIRVSREEELERIIKMMKEEIEGVERDLVGKRSRREEELEETVKQLKGRNLELEAKIDELLSNEKTSSDENCRDMAVLTAASSAKVSWGMAAAAAASTGTVAVALTAFYLRHGRQR